MSTLRNRWIAWLYRSWLEVMRRFCTFHPASWVFIREINMEMTKLEQQILNDEVVSFLDRDQDDLEALWDQPGIA